MRSVSPKRARLNRQRKQIRDALIAERTPCELQLTDCARMGFDWHEVRTRARGGSIIASTNRGWLCRSCHGFVTEHPGWSIRHGWVLNSWATCEDEREAARLRLTLHCPKDCRKDHRG